LSHFDFGVNLAFYATALSAVLCIVYGLYNWNRDGVRVQDEVKKKWANEEDKINEVL